MYLAMTVLAILLWQAKINSVKGLNGILGVSILGILFAGYYTMGELPRLFTEGFGAYILGLPTCALGLIFYILIFICVLIGKSKLAGISASLRA